MTSARTAILRLLLLGIVLLAAQAAFAGEGEDNYRFFREEAARRGGGGNGFSGTGFGSGFGSLFGVDEDNPRTRLRVTPRRHGGDGVGGGSQVMCVRTCDGYAFPIGSTHGDALLADYLCKSSCPGAATQVFMRHPGADISTAVAANKHKTPYAKLGVANLFRTASVDACTCRPRGAIPTGPVYDDPTLRQGDMIVVGGGKVVVFKGARARPFDEDDFVDIKRSRLISQSVRRLVDDRFLAHRVAERAAKTARQRARKPEPKAIEPLPAQAYAPVETGEPKMRIILPAPFEREVTTEPLDLQSAAQAAPPPAAKN